MSPHNVREYAAISAPSVAAAQDQVLAEISPVCGIGSPLGRHPSLSWGGRLI